MHVLCLHTEGKMCVMCCDNDNNVAHFDDRHIVQAKRMAKAMKGRKKNMRNVCVIFTRIATTDCTPGNFDVHK